MRRIIPLILALCTAATVLSGCAGTPDNTASALTPEERAALYAAAVTDARTEEDNEYNPVVSDPAEVSDLVYTLLGFTGEDVEALAVSISLMNIKAYGIAVVMPAEGKADAVKAGLQGFIDAQQQSFQQYLPDQYEVARNARLETLSDGTLVMVMSPDQDAIYDSIAAAVEAGIK